MGLAYKVLFQNSPKNRGSIKSKILNIIKFIIIIKYSNSILFQFQNGNRLDEI